MPLEPQDEFHGQSERANPVGRRDWIKGITATSLAAIAGSTSAEPALAQQASASKPQNRIVEENAKPGSTDWQLTRVRLDKPGGFRTQWIEGYCSKQSVAAGDTLQIMVSTDPPRPFQIEIFRTGYYGGCGARLMTTLGPFEGKKQPVPAAGEKNLHE